MAEFLKIKFEDIEQIKLIGGTEAKTLAQAVAGYSRKPDYVFNAGHFDNGKKSKTYGITLSDTIVDGKCINTNPDAKLSAWKYNEIYEPRGIAFNNNGKMKICSTATAVKEEWTSYIGGSPLLLENWVTNSSKLNSSFANQKTYRIAMGFNDSEIVVGFPKTKMTLKTMTDFMIKQGATNAIALDGGGSVNVRKLDGTNYVHIDELNQNRAVSTFVCVWLKKQKVTKQTTDIPVWSGKKAIGVVEVKWVSVNQRVNAGIGYALVGKLKKGDRITIFDRKGTWLQSYGYWISGNACEWVKTYE